MNEFDALSYAQGELCRAVEAVSRVPVNAVNRESKIGFELARARGWAEIVQGLTPPVYVLNGDVTAPPGGAEMIDDQVEIRGDDIPGHVLRVSYLRRGRFAIRHVFGGVEAPVAVVDIVEGHAVVDDRATS